jgi:hypothetical protein
MHQKIPTAETLAARGIQTSPSCALCNSGAEDAHHLLTDCSFSKQVIHFIWPWYSLDGGPTQVSQEQGMAAWLSTNVARANARNHRETIGILLYYWWNVWKERNRHVLEVKCRNSSSRIVDSTSVSSLDFILCFPRVCSCTVFFLSLQV